MKKELKTVNFRAGFLRAERGFTLIELIVVLVVVGIVFGIAVPNFEKLSPKYSVRAAARELGSELEFIRSQCVIDRKSCGIHYDLERDVYCPVFPPPEDEVDLPADQWPLGQERELPALVSFSSVKLADDYYFEQGTVDVIMDPLGAAGNHIVVLETDEGYVLSLKFNALVGSVDFIPGEAEFERYR